MIVKAIPGRKILHPFTFEAVTDEPIEVDGGFWVRAINDGDVEWVDRPVDPNTGDNQDPPQDHQQSWGEHN